MRSLIELYAKVALKNVFFIVALTIVTILSIRMTSVLDVSLLSYIKYLYFSFLSFHLFLIVHTTYLLTKSYTIFLFLEKNAVKQRVALTITNLGLAIITIIPIGIILLCNIGTIFTATQISLHMIHLVALWVSSALFVTAIAIVCATFIKNNIAYIISLGVYGCFLYLSINFAPNTTWVRYFSILDDYTFIPSNEIAGVMLTKDYILDKVFVFSLALILLCSSFIYISKTHRTRYILGTISSIILAVAIISQGQTKQYEPTTTIAMETKYQITAYKMAVQLNHTLNNRVELTIMPTENIDDIRLTLDDIFQITTLELEDKKVNYTFNNDTIHIMQSLNKGEEYTLMITYNGDVNLIDHLGTSVMYVSPYASNLHGAEFYWYPSIVQHEEIPFTVNVTSKVPVYTTLQGEGHQFTGKDKYVSLFSGVYQQEVVDGITYLYPPKYTLAMIQSELPEEITYNKVIVGVMAMDSELTANGVFVMRYIDR